MTSTDDLKAKLKALRDRLAIEAPRAPARGAPTDLVKRLQSALECVNGMYLLDRSGNAVESQAVSDARDDAMIEGHLALSDWERFLEQDKQKRDRQRAPTPPPIDRRRYERHDTQVTVKLLRYRVNDAPLGDVTLSSETASRPARNVSLGGIFVAVPPQELPNVIAGGVLHVSVSYGPSMTFQTRASVVRRDATGLALRWVEESDRVRKQVESLLQALRQTR